jgi:hypothetical protein
VTAPLQLVRCSACGGSHSDEAHRDPIEALRIADTFIATGRLLEARAWVRVAMKLARETRR